MSFVISVAAGKGGVGKTTTAVNIAAVLAEDRRVLLVDSDPQDSGSASWWLDQRETPTPFDVAADTSPELLSRLGSIDDYDVVVVDTPPRLDSDGFAAVVQASDFVVCPSAPAALDIGALIETVRNAVSPTGVSYRVLLTQVDPRALREALDAQTQLVEAGVYAFGAFIRAYKIHERAPLSGETITESVGPHAADAASDYRRVVAELTMAAGIAGTTPSATSLRVVS